MLPHSIEWNEGELTVRLTFITLIPELDMYYSEANVMHPESMTWVHPLHISGEVFRMLCDEQPEAYEIMKAITEPIIEKRNEAHKNLQSTKP